MPRQRTAISGKRLISMLAQVCCGIVIVLGIGLGVRQMLRVRAELSEPPGWRIIRPPAEVTTLVIDGEVVWTGGKDGLTLIDRRTGAVRALPLGAPAFSYVRGMVRDTTGAIWIAHDGGLARYAGGRWTVFTPETGAPFQHALSVMEARDHTLWVGTAKELACYAHGTWTRIVPATPIVAANSLYQDREGIIWVGCSDAFHGGLYRYDGKSWRAFGLADGLPHTAVTMVLEDHAGTLWVTTGQANQGGLARWRAGRWEAAPVPPKLNGVKMRSVFEDRAGRVWFGSEYDGIAVQNARGWQGFTARDGLAGSEVLAMAQDADGVYWLGTNTGLSRITRFASVDQ